ncbi:PREDICTED: forkhead box protein D3-B-like [Diuraphis noxia]|uniref:forkhead box protein D3-B-like n=1 Tax=Diuraphis noxia TaxID=143948 RepID=UPI000763AEB5|nr:PREDICTED: forkhead box protein D3-B-like [Diuraphis noxia]
MCSRAAITTSADDQLQQGSEAGADAAAADSSQQANLNRYRLHLYNYALQAERLRLSGGWGAVCPVYPAAAAAIYQPRFPVSLFHPNGGGGVAGGLQTADEPKPQHSYIGLIAMAILGSAEGKLVLSDIYQYILDNYPYFRTRGPGWRNSIRHNLSLNDCFVKAGRSANGKGHYWAIHPANVDDFKKGDFRRRKAQRKVRRHMGLAVDDDGNDSPSPPPPPPPPPPPQTHLQQQHHHHLHHHVQQHHHQQSQHLHHQQQQRSPPALWQSSAAGHPHHPFYFQPVVPQPTAILQQQQLQQQSAALLVPARAQKRQFDVASLLAPDPPKRMLQQLHRNDPMVALTATTGAGSSDDDDETATCGGRNGVGGVWEPAGLLQRYYEQQLQAAHRLHAFRQSLGLQRMIGGGPWPTFIVQDRNQTPTPPSLQPYAEDTTPMTDDAVCKTELVD